jgi:uncharacterized protein YcbK (DUF882 family)
LLSRRQLFVAGAAAGVTALMPAPAPADEAAFDIHLDTSVLPPPEQTAPRWQGDAARSGTLRADPGGGGTVRPEYRGSGTARRNLALSGRPRGGLAASGMPRAPYGATGTFNDPEANRAYRPRQDRLSLYNVHTGERLAVRYVADGRFDGDALSRLSHFLRDWREGAAIAIDPQVIDILATLQAATGSQAPVYVLSGYRTPRTNALLARTSDLVARNSLHIRGMAVDFVLPDRDLRALRDHAVSLRAGGVGYYPGHGFLHVDSGRVRTWSA